MVKDFDLNLAPIIDCMTVLITFMLASASFLSIGILDAGVAAAGATAVTDQASAAGEHRGRNRKRVELHHPRPPGKRR